MLYEVITGTVNMEDLMYKLLLDRIDVLVVENALMDYRTIVKNSMTLTREEKEVLLFRLNRVIDRLKAENN